MSLKVFLVIVFSGFVFVNHICSQETKKSEAPGTSGIKSEAHEMQEMVVTGTALTNEPFEQPYAYYRHDRDALDANVGRTALDRINYGPGVFIQHTAPSQTSPFIRGLTGEQSLLLFDGIRLSHAIMRPGPNQYAAMVPDVSIETIDVILGSSSVINGSDGLTGAIDLRMAQAGRGVGKAASPWIKSRVDSANGGILQFGVDGEPHDGRWAYTVEFDVRDFHDRVGGKDFERRVFSNTNANDQIPNTAYEQAAGALRLAFRGISAHEIHLNFGHTDQNDTPRPDGFAENSGKSSKLFRVYDEQNFTYLHLRDIWRAELSWLHELRSTFSWHRHHEKMRRASIKDSGDAANERYRQRMYDDTIDSFGLNLLARTFIAEAHELSWGLTGIIENTSNSYKEYRSPKGTTDPALAIAYEPENWSNRTSVSDGADYRSFGIFAQDSFDITEKVNLLFGARFSHYDWSFGNVDGSASDFTGGLRSLWQFREDMNVFVGLSRAFRAPNLKNLDGAVDRGSSGNPAKGNPDLDPEVSYTAETGWRFLKNNNSISLTLFYTLVDDLIQRDFGGSGEFTNVEDATLTGFEIAWDYGLPLDGVLPKEARLALIGSANLVDATKDIPQPDGTVDEDNISRANRFYGYAGIKYDHNNNWWTRAQVRWHDDYDDVATDPSDSDSSDVRLTTAGAPDGSMPGYGLVDISGGWQSDDKRRAITLIIENVFNKTYRVVGNGADGPGRNVLLAGQVRF